MDAKLKADWVKALRSGEYEQARNIVRHGNALCCIGVGGVVAGLNPSVDLHGSGECADALGLTETQSQKLFEMNDGERKSFLEIADYIEANL